ncbi:MAG: aldo/keto reductase [Planctomycetes bacterium]|nr:aldo/keto reductase [Planctomycetota bacterium]
MRTRPLGRTGLIVSELGFGCAPLGDEYGPLDEAACVRLVHAAIDAGITLFDTAPYYGKTLSEDRLGHALKGKRDGIVLATKCARHGLEEFDFSAAGVRRDLQASLKRLQTDHIDLYQVHDVEFGKEELILEETLPALMEMKERGDVLAVGITGLSLPMLARIAEAFTVDTILSYCHGDILARDFTPSLGDIADRDGLGLINASITHMGVLTPQGPQDWHPAPREVFEAGDRVRAVCEAHERNVAEVALRFAMGYEGPHTTLMGVSDEAQLDSSLSALEQELSDELLSDLDDAVGGALDARWHDGLEENYD